MPVTPNDDLTKHTWIEGWSFLRIFRGKGHAFLGASGKERTPPFLARSAAWLFAANVFYAVCQWGILIVLTKTATQEVVGQFALGFAVATPVMMFAGLQLRTLLVTDRHGLDNVVAYLIVRVSAVGLACAGLFLTSQSWGANSNSSTVIGLVALLKGVEGVIDILHGSWQKKEAMQEIAISVSLRGFLSVLFFSCVFTATRHLEYGLVSLVIVAILMLLLFDIPCWRTIMRPERWTELVRFSLRQPDGESGSALVRCRGIVLLGIPLGGVVALNSLNVNIPRYVLDWRWGVGELGAFAAIGYIMRFSSYFESAIGQAALPRLTGSFAAGDLRNFLALVKSLLAMSCLFGGMAFLMSLLFAEPLVELLYNEQYGKYAAVLPIVVLASAVGSAAGLLKVAVDASRAFFRQVPLFATTAALTLIACQILIPSYGVLGAAYALVVAKCCLLIGYFWILLIVLEESQRSVATGVAPDK